MNKSFQCVIIINRDWLAIRKQAIKEKLALSRRLQKCKCTEELGEPGVKSFRVGSLSPTGATVKAGLWLHVDAVQDPLRPCVPSLRPPQGPDVRLPKIVTLRLRDTAARAVIGPITRTRCKTKTAKAGFKTGSKQVHDCVEASTLSLRCFDVDP